MARENTETSIQKFRFESEAQAENEKQWINNKRLKICVISIFCLLLLNFVLVLVALNRPSEISSPPATVDFSPWANLTHQTVEIEDNMKFELGRIEKWMNSTDEKLVQIHSLLHSTKIDKQLEALEKENRELKKSHEEFKSQFDSLSDKVIELESNISSSLLPPELRGPTENEDEKEISAVDLESISSCSDAMEILPSPRSKKQKIYPHGNKTSLDVLCDFETDGGGWTLIQKRSSGPREQFNVGWDEYVKGFGSLDKNFWLGLDNIHALTKNGDQELRTELEDFEGDKRWAKYSSFSIADASDFYRLSFSGFSGDAGDSMTVNNGQRFSTKDKDNDQRSSSNCAVEYQSGGWWYDGCSNSWLNGLYREKGEAFSRVQMIYWRTWKGHSQSLAKTEMKIRTRK